MVSLGYQVVYLEYQVGIPGIPTLASLYNIVGKLHGDLVFMIQSWYPRDTNFEHQLQKITKLVSLVYQLRLALPTIFNLTIYFIDVITEESLRKKTQILRISRCTIG